MEPQKIAITIMDESVLVEQWKNLTKENQEIRGALKSYFTPEDLLTNEDMSQKSQILEALSKNEHTLKNIASKLNNANYAITDSNGDYIITPVKLEKTLSPRNITPTMPMQTEIGTSTTPSIELPMTPKVQKPIPINVSSSYSFAEVSNIVKDIYNQDESIQSTTLDIVSV